MIKHPQKYLLFGLVCFSIAPTLIPPVSAAAEAENSALTANTLLHKAYEQICKSEFEKAVPTLCQVVRADRNSPTARRYLAFVLVQEGHAKTALAQLDALEKLQRPVTFDILMRGVANDMIGDHQTALTLFQQTMEREPQSDYYRIKTIDELLTLLRYDEALKLSQEGYNSAKDKKIAAIYQQKINKVHSILRLTDRSALAVKPSP